MVTKDRNVSNYLIWAILNVGLPAGAGFLTYWLASVSRYGESPDILLAMSFSSGDLLVVAVLMIVIIVYDVWEYQHSTTPRSSTCSVVNGVCLAIALALSVAFGALKLKSFDSPAPDPSFLHYAALLSVCALGFICLLSLTVKLTIVLLQSQKDST